VILRVIFITALAFVVGGGVSYWKSQLKNPNDDTLVLYGNVDIRQVELAINGNERIAELLVEEGDQVKKGQLLAKLETERYMFAVAKSVLKRYDAELHQAQHDLQDASLYAPNDGIVQNRILEVGDMASPQKTIFTVALLDPVWVRAYVAGPSLWKIWEGIHAATFWSLRRPYRS